MTALKIPTADVFRPLLEHARYKGAYGGRGSGPARSRAFAGWNSSGSISLPVGSSNQPPTSNDIRISNAGPSEPLIRSTRYLA
jgi:hypothetical protein